MTTARARHVLRDDRAGGDERLLADLDAGAEHGPAADPAARRSVAPTIGWSSAWRAIVESFVVHAPGPTNTSSSITENAVM